MDRKKICIDAGHGGHDIGAMGLFNNEILNEKDFNLSCALSLFPKLIQSNFNAIMTRTDDVFLELSERCKIANETQCDLFVSIHANASENKGANGVEVFYISERSKLFAWSVLRNIEEKFPHLENRGIKKGDFLYVLRKTKMPAILVECAFLSNEIDFNILKSIKNVNIFSKAIFDGLKKEQLWNTI